MNRWKHPLESTLDRETLLGENENREKEKKNENENEHEQSSEQMQILMNF